MTAKYNGYYNADVIMDESFYALNEGHEDNFNQILPVYPYSKVETPESVKLELDRAIEKVTKVSRLHESSKWVDDCYVLMGKAQYLQGNYEAAEETLEYFVKNFNPKDPNSRLYLEKEPSSKSKARERRKKAEEARKAKLEERKEKEKQREKDIKQRKKEDKEAARERDQKKKDRSNKKDKSKDASAEEERQRKIKEREAAVKSSQKKEKEKELSAEERRKQRIKEREDAIKNRRREAKQKDREKPKTREEKEAEQKALEAKKIADREAAEKKRAEEKLAREKKRQEEKLAAQKAKEAKEEAERKEKERKEDEKLKKEEAEAEKKRKKENKEADNDLDEKAKGGFLKHQPAYYEGMLWLAKTYISQENFVQAKYYINRIEEESDKGVPPHVINQVPVVRSDLFIKQKNYDAAIDPLRQAIESSDDRTLKARYAFILAQLYQRNGDAASSADAFAKVEKFSNDYNMNLNAKLNQVKNQWAGGSANVEPTIRKLNRMIRDKKNEGFEGPIYFTRAEVKQASGDEAGAIEDFEKALGASVSKISTIEGYYRLATLYYGLEQYTKSKNYYDSTALNMEKRDDRYDLVQRNKTNLTEIVRNIIVISKQDSLLKLGAMSKAERQQYANDIIDAQEEAAEEENANVIYAPPPATTVGGTSKFFAYNVRSVNKGKSSFSSRWGDRVLEDNWRRSNKISASLGDEEESEVQTLEELDSDRQEQIEKILREIPKNKREKQKANEKLEKAYFDLGIGFRNYIKNYQKSYETLLEFVKRFPQSENIVDAYYYLYLNAKDLGLSSAEKKYFDILINDYPDSDYSKVLVNPSFAKELLTEEKKISKAYDEAFYLFEQAEFQSALDNIKKAKSDFGSKHNMMSKYDLLEAMCIGNVEGKDAYIGALRKVTVKHANTPEQTRAREMLRFLKGDGEAFEGEITSEDLEGFVEEDDKLHYIVVTLYEADGNTVNEAKNSINLYNQTNHKDKRIRSTSIYLNQKQKTHLILLRRFASKKISMDYYSEITKDIEDFLDPKKFSYDLYSVNQKNYREIVKQKSTRSYSLFFETYYLGDGK